MRSSARIVDLLPVKSKQLLIQARVDIDVVKQARMIAKIKRIKIRDLIQALLTKFIMEHK